MFCHIVIEQITNAINILTTNVQKKAGIICGSRWTNIELKSKGNDTRRLVLMPMINIVRTDAKIRQVSLDIQAK